jgi:hypothetical protein
MASYMPSQVAREERDRLKKAEEDADKKIKEGMKK